MRFGVVIFLHVEDMDFHHVISQVLHQPVEYVWHRDTDVGRFDCLVLPGGFSYGDYLRAGAVAGRSRSSGPCRASWPAAGWSWEAATASRSCEAGLLRDLRNECLRFRCSGRTGLSSRPRARSRVGPRQVLKMPIAHGEGRYDVDAALLATRDRDQIVFRYATEAGQVTGGANPNGSVWNVAVCNEEGTVGARCRIPSARPRPASAVPTACSCSTRSSEASSRTDPCSAARAEGADAHRVRAEGHPDLAASHGLTREEYDRVVRLLGGSPYSELGLFSALWSEHCSASPRACICGLPTKAPHVLQGPGENAGIVDVGDGFALAFKIESHNHPSFIEPFQGAATGVGGILRDIFTMGARPIALLDSLRFGSAEDAGTRYLLGGVVSGISHYGNCFGCPTVGGEVAFDPEYARNPLVNVLCLGLVPKDRIFRARADGVGNTFLYVGRQDRP